MSDPATKSDIDRLDVSVRKAHERIDEVVTTVADMKSDVGEIKGCVGPLCSDVSAIKNHFLSQARPDKTASTELMKTVRWMIVVIGMLGLAYVGFDSFSASSGDKTIEASSK